MSSWSHMKLVLSVALMSLKACGQRKAEYKLKQAIFRLQEQNKREITRLKETQIKCLILSVNSKQNDELSNITGQDVHTRRQWGILTGSFLC